MFCFSLSIKLCKLRKSAHEKFNDSKQLYDLVLNFLSDNHKKVIAKIIGVNKNYLARKRSYRL